NSHNSPRRSIFAAGGPLAFAFGEIGVAQAPVQTPVSLPVVRSFGETSRRDTWWTTPLVVASAFLAFIIYATWMAFLGTNYHYVKDGADYLSPFYSPELWGDPEHAWFGAKPAWFPAFITPALLILPFPGLFRFTCYYYRGAYYKA